MGLFVELKGLGHAQLNLFADHSARFKQLFGRVQVCPLFLVVLLEMVEQFHERGRPHAFHVDLHLRSDKIDLTKVERVLKQPRETLVELICVIFASQPLVHLPHFLQVFKVVFVKVVL